MRLPKAVFFYLVFCQLFSIATFRAHSDPDFPDASTVLFGFNFTVFDIGFAIALVSLIPLFVRRMKEEEGRTRFVLYVILFHVIYQFLVVVPLSMQEMNLGLNNILRAVNPRMLMLLIPYIYWSVLPTFKRSEIPVRILVGSSGVLLFGGVYNYVTGNTVVTNTGELRLLWGGASILFAFVLVTSFHIVSHTQTNYVLFFLAIVGLVFANHRSAYLVILFLLGFATFSGSSPRVRWRAYVGASIAFLAAILLIWQVPVLSENFFSRIATATDLGDDNAQYRITRWVLSFSYFLQNPLNGSLLTNQYYDVSFLFDAPPHNAIAEILATQGLVGFVSYAAILFVIVRMGLRNKSDPISWQMTLAVLFYIGFCMMNTNFLADWNILMLVFPAAMILYRNKMLLNYARAVVH